MLQRSTKPYKYYQKSLLPQQFQFYVILVSVCTPLFLPASSSFYNFLTRLVCLLFPLFFCLILASCILFPKIIPISSFIFFHYFILGHSYLFIFFRSSSVLPITAISTRLKIYVNYNFVRSITLQFDNTGGNHNILCQFTALII